LEERGRQLDLTREELAGVRNQISALQAELGASRDEAQELKERLESQREAGRRNIRELREIIGGVGSRWVSFVLFFKRRLTSIFHLVRKK
jgi:predicted  nucleic acid-binding Zn-ribbon protein